MKKRSRLISYLQTDSPAAIIILRITSCQYSLARPINRQAMEKVAVPTDSMIVLDNLSYSQSERPARKTAEKMNMRMKAGPARTCEQRNTNLNHQLSGTIYLILNA